MNKNLRKYTTIFQALEDQTRLRIINILINIDEPLCVGEIVDSLDIPQYKVSRHLSTLKNAGLIDYTRDGSWIYYSTALANEPHNTLFTFLKEFLDDEQLLKDIEEVKKKLNQRPDKQKFRAISITDNTKTKNESIQS
jgi:ArsR family transcriptional regulator, arsenate/arsenite/antimonite-responsive transcriptional repressor